MLTLRQAMVLMSLVPTSVPANHTLYTPLRNVSVAFKPVVSASSFILERKVEPSVKSPSTSNLFVSGFHS